MNEANATPASPARRIGAIDVGTNSIRLIVAEAGPDGSYRVLDDEKETSRLGQGLQATGALTPEAMERAAQTIARMSSIARGLGVERLRVIGTCAVREAANRDEFLELVRRRADLDIEPIDPVEEASLAHLSVANAFDLRNLAVAVVDIGGGSTEVILGSGSAIEEIYSLPLGAVRLSEEFKAADTVSGRRFQAMRRAVRRVLRKRIGKPPFAPQLVIGTGGTFTGLASISLNRAAAGRAGAARQPGSLRGYEMKRSEIRHLLDWLRKLPLRARTRVAGLSPDRADIIVAGAVIVERLMKYLGVNRLQVHDGGVRDGLLRTMVRSLFPATGPVSIEPPDPLRSVRQFAASCGYEERHCRHVAQLATQILDQLSDLGIFTSHEGSGNVRTLLEAAALLKDIGYVINYSKHHLHAYHLIVHSDLPGLNPREIQLIANIARYHRKGAPRRKHPNFAALTKPERGLVRRLAAILRIADGLDRTRLQNVRNVRLHLEDKTLHFLLEADQDPAVEVWGAASKSRLFQRAFGLKPCFAWQAEGQGAAASANGAPGVFVETSG